ncbi:DNA-binding MarR family transcriptional regulator [Nocardioides sp. J9]|uniref:MarR family winged helix-turn-helix transcriptional regulator n=1 Tax=Nocardioides sp. J9 TaxID=935844 RepID=UPI0011AD0B5C|nr:MarR family winged helix-turn-helix transcriptional regulator [Nocardioides sp. J9]TWG98593.1 DNA-binding MarR family transcriptional regulator [Nocardioides sp. J9]
MPVDPSELDVATLSFLAGSAANEMLLQRIRGRGHPHLRVSHGFVFQHLVEGDPTVGDLAEALGVTQQAASKATRELEVLGYVTRHADAADRRVTRLALTDHGRDAVRTARRARRDLERTLARAVGEEDLAATRRVLATLLGRAGGEERVRARRVRPVTD